MAFFFFQAEDGIRDIGVTGVQTCALPISLWLWPRSRTLAGRRRGTCRRGRGRGPGPQPPRSSSQPSTAGSCRRDLATHPRLEARIYHPSRAASRKSRTMFLPTVVTARSGLAVSLLVEGGILHGVWLVCFGAFGVYGSGQDYDGGAQGYYEVEGVAEAG